MLRTAFGAAARPTFVGLAMLARGALLAAVVAASAACTSRARVELAPIALPDSPCGNPADSAVAELRVIAYTPSGEVNRETASIDDFPADTMQIGVEIVGIDGTVLAAGKSAPLDFGALADGATIPVAMLPPNGFCRANDMTEPRAHPLAVRAGDGVLVIGGGTAGPSAEYYDPATATFSEVALPGELADLRGVSAATLADGRVALTGAQALTVFDPATRAFSTPSFTGDPRVQHASLGLDASHVLVSGGCVAGSDGTCQTALDTSVAYAITAGGALDGDGTGEPALPPNSVREGGALFDIGTLSDGSRRLVLAGAASDPTTGDAISIGGTNAAVALTGLHAEVTALDGGALLAADGSGAAILAPDGSAAIAIGGGSAAWNGARLVLAEDGSVLAIGGSADVALYTPTTNTWATSTPVGDAPAALDGPALVRLPDGSVLVLGGDAPSASAWLYRPSLVGPASGEVVALPSGTAGIVTPTAPDTVAFEADGITLTAPADDLGARALVGGPRAATATLTASASIIGSAGGIALIADQVAPADALVARFVLGEPARIDRLDGADVTTLCTGTDAITLDQLATGVLFTVSGQSATASVGASAPVAVVRCALPEAPKVGQWGIAATGSGAIHVTTVTVARGQ